MNTHESAELMLETGLFYTATTLARTFRESPEKGQRVIKNILANARYTVLVDHSPVKKYKVTAIDGRTMTIDQLQRKAILIKRPCFIGAQQV
ncbi:hypothetical protein [Pseudoalteromonas tunicata]|jgi:hypothetical protein|uniref:Uncharacterized protein n=1 Tax=Pseudoalteromonas tunicata D2 TaxID=87626 RepID=A4C8S1_9GAMM|nr:hypothetical protein [Pseudoalteromonas tunicata]ATC93489.1 hypothetical protein PTUN_a0745 [Pseudoalteromonas tunicata]AXT32528.1 hypothetical protein D1819_17960 [Pseudoalteromonas tunicata]EAR28986.1 hypothetical protein PTD2_08079 [Pseudoalteromonas tunicata D2]